MLPFIYFFGGALMGWVSAHFLYDTKIRKALKLFEDAEARYTRLLNIGDLAQRLHNSGKYDVYRAIKEAEEFHKMLEELNVNTSAPISRAPNTESSPRS